MFLTLFVIGAAGFLTMAFLSFGHGGGAHHSLRIGPHAAHSGHAGLPAHGSQSPQAGHHMTTPQSQGQSRWSLLALSWIPLSPIDIFSYCLGFGAAGLVLAHSLAGSALIWAAIACAFVYNRLLVRPMMAFTMKFVSRESQGLEGAVASEAEACGQFDSSGRGIVRLTLDGQIVQLLATLDSGELARGVNVSKGDKVVILEVDGARNRCRVSRDLAA